ncbi:MAG TPA: hypothetical protein VGG83_10775 [Trebonia sp.]|jgi:hypothetical protein
MPQVRTVFQPDTLQDVGEQEAAQLEREGLLLDPKAWDGPAPTAPAPAPAVVVAPGSKEAVPDGGK